MDTNTVLPAELMNDPKLASVMNLLKENNSDTDYKEQYEALTGEFQKLKNAFLKLKRINEDLIEVYEDLKEDHEEVLEELEAIQNSKNANNRFDNV